MYDCVNLSRHRSVIAPDNDLSRKKLSNICGPRLDNLWITPSCTFYRLGCWETADFPSFPLKVWEDSQCPLWVFYAFVKRVREFFTRASKAWICNPPPPVRPAVFSGTSTPVCFCLWMLCQLHSSGQLCEAFCGKTWGVWVLHFNQS